MVVEKIETNDIVIKYDFGTFIGFNHRDQEPIETPLTASEVMTWDTYENGEAEFRPDGSRPEVKLLFEGTVTAVELLNLTHILDGLGGDSCENLLRVYRALEETAVGLDRLSIGEVENLSIHVFVSSCISDLKTDAAFELFELYYPDLYKVWYSTSCDGLRFDPSRFLASPAFCVEELKLGDQWALIVSC